MPYDTDGSTGLYALTSLGNGTLTELSSTNMQQLNDESDSTSIGEPNENTTLSIYIIFPELRDLDGYFLTISTATILGNIVWGPFQGSTNTTNGLDGSWSNIDSTADGLFNVATIPNYRSMIHTVSATGLAGVRFLVTNNSGAHNAAIPTLHLYGQPSSGANPDSLRFYNSAGTAELSTVIDEGDIARSAVQVLPFTVKNISATKTASSINITTATLTDASPSLLPQFEFSSDGITFSSPPFSIGSLAPGATTSTLYVQDTVNASAALSVWALRMIATPTTFA
jgi:hypothetical protein